MGNYPIGVYFRLMEGLKDEIPIYEERKKHICKMLQTEATMLSEKARFIKLVSEKKILVFKQPKATILSQLKDNKFSDKIHQILLDMKLHQFTSEKIKELLQQKTTKLSSLEDIKKKPVEVLWATDLGSI